MILTLADDLTGAAEAGGIALRYGLSAEVQTEFFPARDVDLIVADTDSRTCSAAQASQRVGSAFAQYRNMQVERFFKKVDSVLRGNVMAETGALLESGKYHRALLVPANPGLGRTIAQGQYWIDCQPLDHTDFANDPEYPAATADVRQLLLQRDPEGVSQRWPLAVIPVGDELPAQGIVVGEATTERDLLAWASCVDHDTVPVGGAEFLDALLQTSGVRRVSQTTLYRNPSVGGKTLFVCGSTSYASRAFCSDSEARGTPVVRIPTALLEITHQAPGLIDQWADETCAALSEHSHVVIAIDRPLRQEPGLPEILTDRLSMAAEYVLNTCPVQHLLVEGGATAAALVQRMGWTRLRSVRELAPGVVSTQVVHCPKLVLTMKPGSYRWPDEVLTC